MIITARIEQTGTTINLLSNVPNNERKIHSFIYIPDENYNISSQGVYNKCQKYDIFNKSISHDPFRLIIKFPVSKQLKKQLSKYNKNNTYDVKLVADKCKNTYDAKLSINNCIACLEVCDYNSETSQTIGIFNSLSQKKM